MKIKWLEYENFETHLKIDRIDFRKDLTLLVGVSGAGKTQILTALLWLCALALNRKNHRGDFNADASMGKLCFELDGEEYIWTCELGPKEKSIFNEEGMKCSFKKESLQCEGKILFSRDEGEIRLLEYERIPEPKQDESMLSQYVMEPQLRSIYQALGHSLLMDTELVAYTYLKIEGFQVFLRELKAKKLRILDMSEDELREFMAYMHVTKKLYILHTYYEKSDACRNMYLAFFDNLKEIFPEIEDIGFTKQNKDECAIYIKHKEQRIWQIDISNGIMKSLYFLIQMITIPRNWVICMDEFENGLGVNCIDVLVDLLMNERPDLQFIITSHHPKILNGIEAAYWKIIERHRHEISSKEPKSCGINGTTHEAYDQLQTYWQKQLLEERKAWKVLDNKIVRDS